jgi:hypothetical protein
VFVGVVEVVDVVVDVVEVVGKCSGEWRGLVDAVGRWEGCYCGCITRLFSHRYGSDFNGSSTSWR